MVGRRAPVTVVLAAGDFPRRGSTAWDVLASARRVVCCDSAGAAYRRRFRRWPDAIVGDMDSIALSPRMAKSAPLVRCAGQDDNDLAKAVRFCRERGWNDIVVLGATGGREDHALGNVFRALDEMLPVVTDHGAFIPVCGSARFAVQKGAAVSVFAPDPRTKMSSRGLVWPLDGVTFSNLYVATLNRAAGGRFSVRSDRPVMVFVEGVPKAFRRPDRSIFAIDVLA